MEAASLRLAGCRANPAAWLGCQRQSCGFQQGCSLGPESCQSRHLAWHQLLGSLDGCQSPCLAEATSAEEVRLAAQTQRLAAVMEYDAGLATGLEIIPVAGWRADRPW